LIQPSSSAFLYTAQYFNRNNKLLSLFYKEIKVHAIKSVCLYLITFEPAEGYMWYESDAPRGDPIFMVFNFLSSIITSLRQQEIFV